MPGDRPGDPRRVEALEAQIAAMEKAVADAEALGERRRQEAESAARRVEALEAQIATLEEASPRPRVRPSSGAGNPGWPTSGPTVSLRTSSS
jgi:transcription elongation GreA/GreB family factor